MNRGQGNPSGMVIGVIAATITALAGITILALISQNFNIPGPFAETGEAILFGVGDALVLVIGGTGLIVTAILILRGIRT